MPHALEIRGLRKRFPEFALGPLDVTVPAGAIYGFVGPNGSGKSTTIDLIFGMGAKDAGTIRVLGLDHVRDQVAVKRQAGYVSPDLDYRPWGRVRHAIRFVRGFYPSWDDAYCEHLLDVFDLRPEQSIAAFSFGARTKLALVLALAHRPKLLCWTNRRSASTPFRGTRCSPNYSLPSATASAPSSFRRMPSPTSSGSPITSG
jgi:ABC-2 type transport system ATP-binding protein